MEIITRAVAINDGRILAARQRNRPWSFLPGGHVEPGEAIQAALARELVEELSAEAQIGRLIGVVEHAYAEDGTDHHELNLVFEVTLPTSEITSREDHLDFTWLAVTDPAVTDLRPGRLKEAPLTWTETGDRFWRGIPLTVRRTGAMYREA